MNSGSGWLGSRSVAAATLIWLLCPSVSHANSLFVDDFETGDSGAWSQEAVVIPATGAEESVGVKFLPATENGVLGHYGVSLFASPNASGTPELLVGSVGGRLGHVYKHAIRGFQAELSELQAERLSRHPLVKRVVQERYLENPVSYVLPHCFADLDNDFDTNTRVFPPLPGGGAPVQQTLICSNSAPGGDCIDNWGPDRVDQNGLPRDQHFSYRQAAGSVTVYVIDTGVAWTNREFYDGAGVSSRIAPGVDTDCTPYPCGSGRVPCSADWSGKGHGTHVSAIIGGRTFGMAKDVNIVPIKALCYNPQNPSQYSTEEFKLAFEYVLQVHPQNAAMAVVNLSGLNNDDNNHCLFDPVDPNCDYYDQLREAVVSVARRNNLLLVQASGNKTTSPNQPEIDACSRSFGDESRYSNAEHPSGISDSAAIARIIIAAGSDENDGRLRILSGEPGAPIESTIGDCVDIFAPATHIASAFFPLDPGTFDPDEAVCQLSGTSMAAPHVSGVAAMSLQDSPNLTPEELRGMILARGVHDVLESNFGDPNYIGDGSPNLLLHWDPNVFRDGFETGNFVAWSSYFP